MTRMRPSAFGFTGTSGHSNAKTAGSVPMPVQISDWFACRFTVIDLAVGMSILSVDAPEKVVGRHMIVEPETVEQRALRHLPTHHVHTPAAWQE